MSAKYKKSKDRTFVNPYNFVAINRKKIEQKRIEETYKDKELLHTGYLDCVLVARTPLAIPDLPDNTENMHDFFSIGKKKEKQYAIPGSSLRGMIRSVYETITDSCLSTMKPETHLFTRVETGEAYNSGILKEEDGEWKLYDAELYKIPDKNKVISKEKLPYRTEIKGEIRYIVSDDNIQFRLGDKVEAEIGKIKIKNRKGEEKDVNCVLTLSHVNELEKHKHESESGEDKAEEKVKGYIYVGESFSNKKFERVFKEDGEIDLRKGALKNAMRLLEETLKVYKNQAINKKYPDEHTGYADYKYAKEKNKGIPVWYKKDEKTRKVKLSMACIGRIGYYNTLDDLVKKKVPCQNRAKLCSACSLFGMIGEEAIGGRIRITDAKAEGKIEWQKNVRLKTLATPRYSYWPFYTKTNSSKYPKDYEKSEVEIRGRKYYWHIPEAAYNRKIYTDLRSEKEINEKMQSGYFNLADTGSKFSFRIYYDQITSIQLDELKWTLCLGENQLDSNLCHKLGRGKPLGLGSVKICVISQTERKIYPEYYLETEEDSEKLEGKLYKECESIKELKYISDFNRMKEKTVEYPSVLCSKEIKNKDGLEKNDLASHQWFSENKLPENIRQHEVQCLPEILEEDPSLYYYEYTSDEETNQDGNSTIKKKNKGKNKK